MLFCIEFHANVLFKGFSCELKEKIICFVKCKYCEWITCAKVFSNKNILYTTNKLFKLFTFKVGFNIKNTFFCHFKCPQNFNFCINYSSITVTNKLHAFSIMF